MGEADIGGKEKLDVDPSLREKPAADHVVEEIAGVEAVFAEEKDRESAGRFCEIGPGNERQHIGKTGSLGGKPMPFFAKEILRDKPLDQILRPIAIIFSLDSRTPELEVKF